MSFNRINTKQKAIAVALPKEPASGLSKWIDLFSGDAGNGSQDDHSNSSKGANGFMKPLITALVILLLGYLGYQIFSGDGGHDDHTTDHSEQMKHDEAKQDASMNSLEDHSVVVKEAHGNKTEDDSAESHGDDVAPMDSKGLDFAQGTWAYTLSDWLAHGSGSKTFSLDKIPFDGGDDDAISAEGTKQLENLAKILNAYPEVNAEIQGHTAVAKNAVGRTKKKATSKARAFWVQQKLKGMGVDGKKLSSKGYADQNLLSSVAEDADGQKRIIIKFDK